LEEIMTVVATDCDVRNLIPELFLGKQFHELGNKYEHLRLVRESECHLPQRYRQQQARHIKVEVSKTDQNIELIIIVTGADLALHCMVEVILQSRHPKVLLPSPEELYFVLVAAEVSSANLIERQPDLSEGRLYARFWIDRTMLRGASLSLRWSDNESDV
jgi:hypothetical protein